MQADVFLHKHRGLPLCDVHPWQDSPAFAEQIVHIIPVGMHFIQIAAVFASVVLMSEYAPRG
jgi:hypothetical protein